MRLNDKELNYILSECIKSLLNEDNTLQPLNKEAQKQQINKYKLPNTSPKTVSNINVDINGKWDGNLDLQRNSPSKGQQTYTQITKNNRGKNIGKALGKVGIAAGVGLALAMIGGTPGFLWGAIKTVRGARLALQGLYKSHKMFKQLNNFEIPKDKEVAKKLAILAATERADLQNKCKNVQQNLLNSIKAFNEAHSDDKTKLTWEQLKNEIGSNARSFPIASSLGGGYGEVNDKTNFTDINVTEGKLFENDFDKNIQTFDYKNINIEDALNQVVALGELYCELYQLWYSYTRYIQVLIAKFPKYLKWNDIISSVGKAGNTESLFSELIKAVGNTSAFVSNTIDKVSKAVDQRNKDRDNEDEEVSNEDALNQFKQTTFRVIKTQVNPNNNAWGGGKQSKITYTLFGEMDVNGKLNGVEYALPTNVAPKAAIDDMFIVTNIKKYVTDGYISTDNNNNVRIFSNAILNAAKPQGKYQSTQQP